jgi:hypothetical protein
VYVGALVVAVSELIARSRYGSDSPELRRAKAIRQIPVTLLLALCGTALVAGC